MRLVDNFACRLTVKHDEPAPSRLGDANAGSRWAVAGTDPAEWLTLTSTRHVAPAGPDSRRRVFQPLIKWECDSPASPVRVRVMTSLTVPASVEADLADWYAEEHAPALLAIPGWLSVSRYRLVEGAGPTLLALHDLDSEDPLHSPGYSAAVPTPWGDRIFAAAQAWERRVLVRPEVVQG